MNATETLFPFVSFSSEKCEIVKLEAFLPTMSVCRFHDLGEFDESKRSCRRRLAGHNERRRKSNPEGGSEGSKGHHHPKETTQCRLADERGRIQMNLPGSSGYKSFNIR